MKDWQANHVVCMKWALWWKFSQNKPLRATLLETGEAELVHYAPWGDVYWGVNKQFQGNNLQGKLLMQLRDKLREQSEPVPGLR